MFHNMPYTFIHLEVINKDCLWFAKLLLSRQCCENVYTSTVAEFVVIKASHVHVLPSINTLTTFLNATIPHAKMD